MARKKMNLFDWLVWISVTLVGLGFGWAAAQGSFPVPFVPAGLTVLAGWVIFGTTIWAAVLNFMK